MKTCSLCKQTKDIFDFYIISATNKPQCLCKVCSNTRTKQWKLDNKERVSKYDKEWQQSNKDKKSKNYKHWQVNNRAKVNSYNSYRRALELHATPTWLTEPHKIHIQCKYSLAKMLSRETGIKHHVDHVVPLKGKTVCGLHVPWNLRVIPATENLRKSNKI